MVALRNNLNGVNLSFALSVFVEPALSNTYPGSVPGTFFQLAIATFHNMLHEGLMFAAV